MLDQLGLRSRPHRERSAEPKKARRPNATDRRAAGHEHDLGRRRRPAPRADGRASASRRRPPSTSRPPAASAAALSDPASWSPLYNWARPRDLSHYETLRALPRHLLPARRGAVGDAVRAAGARPWPVRRAHRAGPAPRRRRSNANPAPNSLDPPYSRRRRARGHPATGRRTDSDPELGAQIDAAVKQRLDAWVHSQGQGRRGRRTRLSPTQGRAHHRPPRTTRRGQVGDLDLSHVAARGRSRRQPPPGRRRPDHPRRLRVPRTSTTRRHQRRSATEGTDEGTAESSTTRVGQVRPSQLLHTYGPGSLVDLPHLSVLVAGLDAWGADPIASPRSLRSGYWPPCAVGRGFEQVNALRLPPHLVPRPVTRSTTGPVSAFPWRCSLAGCGARRATESPRATRDSSSSTVAVPSRAGPLPPHELQQDQGQGTSCPPGPVHARLSQRPPR